MTPLPILPYFIVYPQENTWPLFSVFTFTDGTFLHVVQETAAKTFQYIEAMKRGPLYYRTKEGTKQLADITPYKLICLN